MSRLLAPSELAATHLTLCALVLIWNLWVAGRATRLHSTPPTMALLSALGGLLVVPALTVHIASNFLLSGRTLHDVTWVWPVTVVLITAQVVVAIARGLVAPPIGIALALYDLLLALIYAARYAIASGIGVGVPLVGLLAAQEGALAFSADPRALLLPYFLYLPIMAPPTPGRRGVGTVLRTAVAVLAVAWSVLVLIDWPDATRAVASYDRYAGQRLQERSDSDFVVGLKIFPSLDAGPPPLSLQRDLALADTLGVQALSVYVSPAGASPAALDSLGRSLDAERADKVLVVALDLSREHRVRALDRMPYLRRRVADAARIAERVHPDFVVPVLDPTGAAARAVGPLGAAQWAAYLREAAVAVHRANAHVRVMAHIGGYGARDSALYAWAAAAAPVDAVALSLFPWVGGAATLDSRMRTADAWLRAARSDKDHWVLECGGLPLVHGPDSQARAIWGGLVWATSRAAIKGLIVYEANDYDAPLGLESPDGTPRPAAIVVRQAIRSLSESGGT